MRDVTPGGGNERALIWVHATEFFSPNAPDGWKLVNFAGTLGRVPEFVPPSAGYSVIFEATFNSMLGYDPVIQARALWEHFKRVPDALVAVVAPNLEVPVATQHAVAHEVGVALGHARVHVVTQTERWTAQSDRKMRKALPGSLSANGPRGVTGIDEAVEIVVGRRSGARVEQAAVDFVYAYTSRASRRTPFRCTSLQRSILQMVAAGDIVPSTSVLARAARTTDKEVNESIAELVAMLVPRGAGEPDARDGHQRLFWLVRRYGPWILLVDGRSRRWGDEASSSAGHGAGS